MDLISSSLATSERMDHDMEFKYKEPSKSSNKDSPSLGAPIYLYLASFRLTNTLA